MQSGKMHPDWMQWIPCSVVECSGFHAGCINGTLLNAVVFFAAWFNAVESTQHDCMQWIYAAWPKASRFNAVDSIQRHWMQSIPCIVAQWIPIICSGVHAARPSASRLNAVDCMQHGPKLPDWMQWIRCIVMECSVIHATRKNASRLNAVDSMQPD